MGEKLLQTLETKGLQVLGIAVNLVIAIIIFLVGLFIASLVAKFVRKILERLKVDNLADKLNGSDFMHKSNLKILPSVILSKIIYWVMLLLFLLISTETLGLEVVSEQVSSLINYIPKLLSALLVFGIGLYIADLIRGVIASLCKSLGVQSWNVISSLVFYFLLIAITVTALNQAGIDTEIITSNVSIIIGGAVLAFAISYGFAARDILSSILTSFYSKNHFKAGQVIEIDGHVGRITRLDNVSVTIRQEDKEIVFPLNRLLSEKVIIHNQ